jgi:hypothetical protein
MIPTTIPRQRLLRVCDAIVELVPTYQAAEINAGQAPLAMRYGQEALRLLKELTDQVKLCQQRMTGLNLQRSPQEARVLEAFHEVVEYCRSDLDLEIDTRMLGLLFAGRRLRAAVEAVPLRPLREALDDAELLQPQVKGQRLLIDLYTNTITLDGTPYPDLDPTAVRLVKAYNDKAGTYVSSKEVCASVPGCRGGERAVRRRLSKLPPAIRALLKGKPGAGRCLQLPTKEGAARP